MPNRAPNSEPVEPQGQAPDTETPEPEAAHEPPDGETPAAETAPGTAPDSTGGAGHETSDGTAATGPGTEAGPPVGTPAGDSRTNRAPNSEPLEPQGQAPDTEDAGHGTPDEAESRGQLPEGSGPVHEVGLVQADDDGRASRRRSPVLVASVAAAVLLVGGGGAYLAATAGGGSGGTRSSAPGGEGTPPPLALDGYAASSGGTNGIAPGEPNPYGVTYRASGKLPDGPGSAPVYRPAGEVTGDEVARLAEAFGLDGTPVAEGQIWRVGPGKDGSGPSLQVSKEAPGSWTFSRYAPGTDNCKKITVCAQDPGAPAGDPVSVTTAQKAAAPVLKALGQDDAKVDASQVMGAQRVVNADPVVGGLPTYGWTTGLTVGKQGEVVGGSGLLKTPVKGDTYPVLSAKKTLDLMNGAPRTDHRMGIGGCATPVPLKDRLEQPCGSGAPAPGQNRSTLTVTHAVFGLASHSVEGRQALVPSWLFEVRGSQARGEFTVTYPAVDPRFLTSATPPAEPTSPGDGTASAPKTKNVQADGYTADGKELTVSFTGGVCADYTASADEGSDRVTVTVTEKPWPNKICILIAKQYERTVQLDEPLGTRKVVGPDGREIAKAKPGARLPVPSSQAR
ncbi:hypothetical protein [Streptomyces sp. NPDC058964]|uniref:hypothetical protein n=1 Tax=Streptomyces sp. NPDC058964 TaxID=3346681 RepID=UPI0036D06611